MGLFGWILYIFCGVLFYFAIEFIGNKITLGKVDKIIFLNVFNIIVSGLLFRYSIRYTDNIFLVFVFVMLTDIIYNTYIVDRDFFDNDSGGIYYYIGLVITGFIINQEFINKVNNVFLSGNEFRLVLWLLIIVYFYNLFKNEKIFHRKDSNEKKVMSVNNILNNYAKFKYTYYDDCDHDNKVISNILYAIMIYEDNRRSKFLRDYDNFMYKINGGKSISDYANTAIYEDFAEFSKMFGMRLKEYCKNHPERTFNENLLHFKGESSDASESSLAEDFPNRFNAFKEILFLY